MDRTEPILHGTRAVRTVQADEEGEMYVNLLVELYSHSKEQLLDVVQYRLPNMQAVEKMREIRNVGLEDELGYWFAPSQVSCRIRPVA